MGQISLPRLEKINTTMHWESSLLLETDHWLNPKLFVFNKLLAQVFFKKTISSKVKMWKKNSLKFKRLKLVVKNNKSVLLQWNNTPLFNNRVLGNYIFKLNNSYVNMVVYSSKKITK